MLGDKLHEFGWRKLDKAAFSKSVDTDEGGDGMGEGRKQTGDLHETVTPHRRRCRS